MRLRNADFLIYNTCFISEIILHLSHSIINNLVSLLPSCSLLSLPYKSLWLPGKKEGRKPNRKPHRRLHNSIKLQILYPWQIKSICTQEGENTLVVPLPLDQKLGNWPERKRRKRCLKKEGKDP